MITHGSFAMRVSTQLRDALGNYRVIEDDLVAIGVRRDEQRKQALVRSRRLLAEQMGKLGLSIEQDTLLATDSGKQQEMNRLFAAMRYSLALHQANWPAVKIDEDPVAYQASAHNVQEKSRAFWAWCRDNLGVSRDQIGA